MFVPSYTVSKHLSNTNNLWKDLFNPKMGPKQIQPLWFRVDLRVIAMKIFRSGLLLSDGVKCHTQDTPFLWREGLNSSWHTTHNGKIWYLGLWLRYVYCICTQHIMLKKKKKEKKEMHICLHFGKWHEAHSWKNLAQTMQREKCEVTSRKYSW